MPNDVGFQGFSCLSMLYAQHAWLMRRISDTYSGEIASFLDSVRDRTARLLLPRTLQESITMDGCRYWWVGNVHDSSRWRIYLRVDPRLPEIVWPGELHAEIRCGAAWRDVTDSRCCQCAHGLCSTCDSKDKSCVIRYHENDPVDTAAARLASLLADCEPLVAVAAKC
jgi:hypothetical protein